MAPPLIKPALVLMSAAAAALALTAGFQELWRNTIAENRAQYESKLLAETLAGVQYHGVRAETPADLAELLSSKTTPLPRIQKLWRATHHRKTAAVAVLAKTQGYNGEIVFTAAFDRQGDIIQTRIVRHRETPGIAEFLSTPGGGKRATDGVAGATITSNAVSNAVRQTRAWIKYNQRKLFEYGKNG